MPWLNSRHLECAGRRHLRETGSRRGHNERPGEVTETRVAGRLRQRQRAGGILERRGEAQLLCVEAADDPLAIDVVQDTSARAEGGLAFSAEQPLAPTALAARRVGDGQPGGEVLLVERIEVLAARVRFADEAEVAGIRLRLAGRGQRAALRKPVAQAGEDGGLVTLLLVDRGSQGPPQARGDGQAASDVPGVLGVKLKFVCGELAGLRRSDGQGIAFKVEVVLGIDLRDAAHDREHRLAV